MMDNNGLRDKYKSMLQQKPVQPAVDPAGQTGVDPTVAPVPLDSTTPVDPNQTQQDTSSLGGDNKTPNFPANLHRFNFNSGDSVSYYDETGNVVVGAIDGAPIGDKYQVLIDGGSSRASILKSELFTASRV